MPRTAKENSWIPAVEPNALKANEYNRVAVNLPPSIPSPPIEVAPYMLAGCCYCGGAKAAKRSLKVH